jgi:hypothetical protein
MRIFISGKITGTKNYRRKFKRAERRLKRAGHQPVNPAVFPDGWAHEQYMYITMSMLETCEAIYMLNDGDNSLGAEAEKRLAKELRLPIFYEGEGIICKD